MASPATRSCLSGATDDPGEIASRLFAEHQERLLGYCLGRLRSRSEAEDAVQITFLYAFRALRSGDVPECESAWLHTIARNVCRWQQRTAARRPLPGERGLELVASPERVEDEELLAGLDDALASIPERQRRALLLREWRGLSAQEIAEHLHLSPGATNALLTRARRSLAHALTTPQRAALGVVSLVYELRSWFKAAVGVASAKVAVATVAVIGAGVGGAVADESVAGDRGSRQPVESARPAAVSASGGRVVARSRAIAPDISGSVSTSRVARRTHPRLTATTVTVVLPPLAADPVQTIRGRTGPGSTADPGYAPAPTAREPNAPATGPFAGIPLDLPAPEVPPPDLPPMDVPPIDVPPVDLPTDVIPPLDLPPIGVPPADPPPLPPPPPLLP